MPHERHLNGSPACGPTCYILSVDSLLAAVHICIPRLAAVGGCNLENHTQGFGCRKGGKGEWEEELSPILNIIRSVDLLMNELGYLKSPQAFYYTSTLILVCSLC